MGKCVHGYESNYCGQTHSAWSDDQPSEDYMAVLRRVEAERRQRESDEAFMKTGGIYPAEGWSDKAKAKQYFQKKLEQYGYAKHPDPHEYRLEDDFQVCKNCTTMSILNAYGLCRYCEELSELNRRQAVTDGHMTDYHKLKRDISINHRIYYGMFGLWIILMGLIALSGSGELVITAGVIGGLSWALATPGYVKAQRSVKGKIRKLMEDHPELQKLAARPTTGSTGPR